MAMRASAACRLPTCLCSRPERARMKTSNSGQSSLMPVAPVFGRVGGGGFPDPAALPMRLASRLQPLLVARPVALQPRLELAPVDGAGEVVLASLVPAQRRIGNGEPEELRLRHRDVDELLPQLVVGEALDAPAHRLRRVSGGGIARPEH